MQLRTKILCLLLPFSTASLLLSSFICIFFLDNIDVRGVPPVWYTIMILCIIMAAWINAMVDLIVYPLSDLNRKISLLKRYEIELSLDPAYKNSSADIHALYESFSSLSLTFNFANNVLGQKDNETMALLSYADSYQNFKGKNEKAMGICMNNIGNIHYRAKRYNEAAKAYEEAIQIGKKMLEKYFLDKINL